MRSGGAEGLGETPDAILKSDKPIRKGYECHADLDLWKSR